MGIRKKLESLQNKLDKRQVKLVAISKKKPVEEILAAYEAGQRIFGENRAQELVKKQEALPEDIRWHMVGHLQRNKVKKIIGFVSMIQSVDSLRLLKEIDKRARKNDRIIDGLLQVHIAKEKSKYGFTYDEVEKLARENVFAEFENVRICGLMGMATLTDDTRQIKEEFRALSGFFKKMKSSYFEGYDHFSALSMGMTNDWEIAVEEGSTMVRIGRLIFGERE